MEPNEQSPISQEHDLESGHIDDGATPRRRKSRVAVGFTALFVLAILAAGMAPRWAQSQKLSESVKAVKDHIPTVNVVTAKTTSAADTLSLPSNLQAIAETTINARSSGYVRARYADIGSRVVAGQELAEIESPEIDQQVRESAAEVARAEAGVGQASADVVRLNASISGARSSYTQYVAALGQAKADLVHLQAKYAESQAAVDVSKAKLIQANRRLDGFNADLAKARVDEKIAEITLKRWKELEVADAVAGQDVDEKQSIYDSSQAKVSSAEADVSSSKADVQAATETVRSQQEEALAAKADIESGKERIQAAAAAVQSSRANIDAAIAARDAGRSNVSAAHAIVGSNEANESRYAAIQTFEKVVAPFSGVITARNFDVGDLVNATSSGTGANDQTSTVTKTGLFGLARTDAMLAQVNVPEDSSADIHEGQLAIATTREYPGKTFPGKVMLVSGALDSASRTLLVEVKVPNPTGLLKPGMYSRIQFMGVSGAKTIRIPATAMIFDTNGTRVAEVTQDSTVHYAKVTVGRDFGDTIEVLGGLRGGEVLISNPDVSLDEGAKVRPLEGSN